MDRGDVVRVDEHRHLSQWIARFRVSLIQNGVDVGYECSKVKLWCLGVCYGCVMSSWSFTKYRRTKTRNRHSRNRHQIEPETGRTCKVTSEYIFSCVWPSIGANPKSNPGDVFTLECDSWGMCVVHDEGDGQIARVGNDRVGDIFV